MMVEKRCPDCHRLFEATTSMVRCKVCQDNYRRRYKKEWWTDKPASATRYYDFYQMIRDLTPDELRALVSAKKRAMKEKEADISMLRTHIKMLCEEYTRKVGEYFDPYEEDE